MPIQKFDTEHMHRIIFNSIAEFSDFIEADDQDKAMQRRKHTSLTYKAAMSVEKARECARLGGYWPEGAKNIEPIELDVDALNASDLAIKLPEAAMQGYRANVGAFLSGAPKCMVKTAPAVRPNRLLRIGVQVGKAWDVEQHLTFNRGNAILSVLNALHELGFAIELWAVERTYERTLTHCQSNEVCIKRASDSYSPDSIAFALCNDAYQRRLCWRSSEIRSDTNPHVQSIIDAAYGMGQDVDFSDFDISYGYLLNRRQWHNKAYALDHIVKDTKRQLDKMREGL